MRSQASAGPTIIGVEQTFQYQHMKSCSSSMERWWWLFQGHWHRKDLTLARSLGFFQQQIVQAVLVSMCKENWEKVSAHVCSSVNKLRLRVFFFRHLSFLLLNAVSQPAPEPWLLNIAADSSPSYSSMVIFQHVCNLTPPFIFSFLLQYRRPCSLILSLKWRRQEGKRAENRSSTFNLSRTPRRVPH